MQVTELNNSADQKSNVRKEAIMLQKLTYSIDQG